MRGLTSTATLPAALTLARFRPTAAKLVMPDVCCDLVWADGSELSITGPLTHARPSKNVGREVTLVRLDPLVASAWLRMPLAELTDRAVPVADVHPFLANALTEAYERGALAALVRPGPLFDDAHVRSAASALAADASVTRAASTAGLSLRQFERVFVERTGLSPKLYARILRFRRAMAVATSGAPLCVAAHAGGYADQAHFSRDARTLTGLSPSGLLRRDGGNVQDVIAGTI